MTWNPKIEIDVNGWTDISGYVYARDAVVANRGRRAEGSTADASTLNCTINNRDRRFSPRNPTGPYYGYLNRNTPLRASVDATESALVVPAASMTDGATTPDYLTLDITGDIDVRCEFWAASWWAQSDFIGKWTAGSQQSWRLGVWEDGTLEFRWSPSGSNEAVKYSTAVVPLPCTGRKAIRVTLDVNNGAGGNTVTFYTSDSLDGTWTQLGDPVVTAGTTSIYSSTAPLRIGYWDTSTPSRWYRAQVRNGIGGTVVASPDFRSLADGTTYTVDSSGRPWTVTGDAYVNRRQWLHHGEVSDWTSRRDTSGKDVHIPATSSGVMRRLGKGAALSKSVYNRGCTSPVAPMASLVEYWPMEDTAGSVGFASALPGGQPMQVSGDATYANNSDFNCSLPLPTMGTGQARGVVRGYTSTGQIQVRCLAGIPDTGLTNGAVLLAFDCAGTATHWELSYGTGGTLTLKAWDSTGTLIMTNGPAAFSLDGTSTRLHVSVSQSGSNVAWTYSSLKVGETTGYYVSGTLSSRSVTKATMVTVAPNRDVGDGAIGHVTVQSAVTGLFELADLINAYSGEIACARVARLCAEEGVACRVLGYNQGSVQMGNQGQDSLLGLLREVESTEGGILYEPRDFFGIEYRTVRGLYNQDPLVTFDYTAGLLSSWDPADDDQMIANAVVASRPNGSSATYELTTGSMSTQDPPYGVGRYESPVTANVATDGMLEDAASWAVNVGTADEPRLPGLRVNLSRSVFTSNEALTRAVAGLNPGDLIWVTNPPDGYPWDMKLLVVGTSPEVFDNFSRELTLVCVPEAPYRVLVWGDSATRYGTWGSTLNAGISSSAGGLYAAWVGSPWSHADGDFNITIGGEDMTVTAVTGTASPQYLTVTRAVNGVSKAHSANATITLADQRRWGR